MRYLGLLLLLSLISACNLVQATSSGSGATLQPLFTPESALVSNCDPNQTAQGWFVYTAAAGETVEDVIQRVGAVREMVMSANCWTEIPPVSAGNQWYMPPASIEPLPDLSNVAVGGTLTVTPSEYGIGGTWSLIERNVILGMEDYPANAASVFFYVRIDGEVIGIGTDTNMADGATMSWQALPNLTYDRAALAAVAYDATSTPILRTQEFGFNTM